MKDLMEKYLVCESDPFVEKIYHTPEGRRIGRVIFSWDKNALKEYVLELKDGWFRRPKNVGPAAGHGIMFKSVKLLTPSRPEVKNFTVRKISFTYLPTASWDQAEDVPASYEKETGWLWVSDEPGMPSIEEVVVWMNKQAKRWTP